MPNPKDNDITLIAITKFGLEGIVKQELRELGYEGAVVVRRPYRIRGNFS